MDENQVSLRIINKKLYNYLILGDEILCDRRYFPVNLLLTKTLNSQFIPVRVKVLSLSIHARLCFPKFMDVRVLGSGV